MLIKKKLVYGVPKKGIIIKSSLSLSRSITHHRRIGAPQSAGRDRRARVAAHGHQVLGAGRLAQHGRAIGPGGAARQPEHGQHGGDHEVGQRQFALVVVQIVGVRIDGGDEQTVEHRQDAGGDEELRIGRGVHGHNVIGGASRADGRLEVERIAELGGGGLGRRAARLGDGDGHVDGGGERENGQHLRDMGDGTG